MKDVVKVIRKLLRPGYSYEMNGKGVKQLNRKIARKKLKAMDQKEWK